MGKEINHLWELVKNKKNNTKYNLAGHIDSSYTIVDKGNWFFNNVIKYCIQTYSKHFEDWEKEFLYQEYILIIWIVFG